MAGYFEDWCAEVTDQVRFKPDRSAIERELRAHYDDHCADLLRLGYPPRLAQQRALGAMGDPAEIGRALDRAHRPWLGRLWQASWAALAAALLLSLLWMMDGSPWLRRVWNTVLPPEDLAGYEEQMAAYDVLLNRQEGHDYIFYEGPLEGEAVRMEGYTLSVLKGRWYRWESGSGYYRAYLLLRIAPDRLWYGQPENFPSNLQMTASTGQALLNMSNYESIGLSGDWFTASYASNSRPVPGTDARRLYDSADLGGWYIWMEATVREAPPEWVDITYPYGDNDWTMRIQWEAET